MPNSRAWQRIMVIGPSGCGKSTLARELGNILKLPYIETDEIFWHEHWQPVAPEEVTRRIGRIVAGDHWVIDGNFDEDRALVWHRAEFIVWLDLSRWVTVASVLRRNLAYLLTDRAIWSGNRMTWRRLGASLVHAYRSHSKKARLYPDWLSQCGDAEIIRFTNRRELALWLDRLKTPHT